jgi:hypothetical protein
MSTSTPPSSALDPATVPLPPTPPTSPLDKNDPSTSASVSSHVIAITETSGTSAEANTSTALIVLPPPELVLCIFIHGFKGTDSTFGAFPHRVGHLVEQVLKVGRGHADNLDDNSEGAEPERLGGKVTVECLVFPAYEVSLRPTSLESYL